MLIKCLPAGKKRPDLVFDNAITTNTKDALRKEGIICNTDNYCGKNKTAVVFYKQKYEHLSK